ncbi:D-alanyl-lipoteichoic acid biosynthesis protein DltD [Phascolarctobacterium succinatutens]|uniref:D-alanyl-lipoteichoic acid biosynthesis protein DltD n=1 Tax=Phascolarctobacterium succinatutens TaxID=626940 RepID=UPI003AB5203C
MNTKKIISCVVAPLVITGLLVYSVNEYCVRKTEEWYPTSGVWRLYNNDVKDKGIALLNLSVKNGHMMMFGTSELNNSPDIKVTTVPTSFYPNQYLNREVDIVGYAGADTLINAIRLGSITNLGNVPSVYISSFTWFIDKEYYKEGIQKNFSELQYYKFMNNPRVSGETKKEISRAVVYVLDNKKMFNESILYAKLYSDNTFLKQLARVMLKPFYEARYAYLNFRDNIRAYKLVKKYQNKYRYQEKNIKWQEDRDIVAKQSRALCTTTPSEMFAYKKWYNWHKNNDIDEHKDKFIKSTVGDSKEYDYHELLLKVVSEEKIKPLVILTSANGYYWDFAGLAKSERIKYFDKCILLQEKYDIPYLNLAYMSYIPYTFRDQAHYTSQGWFEVNEKITKHFTK